MRINQSPYMFNYKNAKNIKESDIEKYCEDASRIYIGNILLKATDNSKRVNPSIELKLKRYYKEGNFWTSVTLYFSKGDIKEQVLTSGMPKKYLNIFNMLVDSLNIK